MSRVQRRPAEVDSPRGVRSDISVTTICGRTLTAAIELARARASSAAPMIASRRSPSTQTTTIDDKTTESQACPQHGHQETRKFSETLNQRFQSVHSAPTDTFGPRSLSNSAVRTTLPFFFTSLRFSNILSVC